MTWLCNQGGFGSSGRGVARIASSASRGVLSWLCHGGGRRGNAQALVESSAVELGGQAALVCRHASHETRLNSLTRLLRAPGGIVRDAASHTSARRSGEAAHHIGCALCRAAHRTKPPLPRRAAATHEDINSAARHGAAPAARLHHQHRCFAMPCRPRPRFGPQGPLLKFRRRRRPPNVPQRRGRVLCDLRSCSVRPRVVTP